MERTYKVAPLGRVANIRVTEGAVVELTPSGSVRQNLPFADLNHARWTRYDRKGMSVRTLVLDGVNGSFTLTLSAPTRRSLDEDAVEAFNDVLAACLDRIEVTKPELSISVGPPPLVQWIFFAGYLAIGAVLLIPLDGVLNHRKADDLWWVAAVLGACIIGTLVFAFLRRPWKTPASRRPSALKSEVLAGQRR